MKINLHSQHLLAASLLAAALPAYAQQSSLSLDSDEEWQAAQAQSEGITLENNLVFPTEKKGLFRSKVLPVEGTQKAKSLQLKQSPHWLNWEKVESFAPNTFTDAPIVLRRGEGDYWFFGRYKVPKKQGTKTPITEGFTPQPATLEGFEIPLLSTPFPNEFTAPGGLEKDLGGYHAWQSKDMKNWVHHGPVSDNKSRWATTAEFLDNKLYLYYDYPNDQDPHLIVDNNLTDGKMGEDKGLAFLDPSNGSDCTIIRDLDGNFHLIYEDWSPINPRGNGWDSPLAGHAVSKTGQGDFQILKPAVDYRTKPTGETGTYPHPHWKPSAGYQDRVPSNIGEYEIHQPEQKAFGDWAAIAIGSRYYLFGDYEPTDAEGGKKSMNIGLFTSEAIDQPFEFYGSVGKGHPDPDILFAQGKFYLFAQMNNFFISDGPWVEKITARVGVDVNGNGQVDQWSDWQEVQESYQAIEGFAKQVALTPAKLELGDLPAGKGFAFEIQMEDIDKSEDEREKTANNSDPNASVPKLDSLRLEFE